MRHVLLAAWVAGWIGVPAWLIAGEPVPKVMDGHLYVCNYMPEKDAEVGFRTKWCWYKDWMP